jgi:hypothetical protein
MLLFPLAEASPLSLRLFFVEFGYIKETTILQDHRARVDGKFLVCIRHKKSNFWYISGCFMGMWIV